MDDQRVTRGRKGLRARAIGLAPVAAGVILGGLAGTRAMSLWESDHTRVPTEGLLYMGAICVVGGLLALNPALWRSGTDANVRVLRRLQPRSDRPGAQALRWILDRKIAGEERDREDHGKRRRLATSAIAAGVTIICLALLR